MNEVQCTINIHYGTVRSDLRIRHVCSDPDFFALDLEAYSPSIFFDDLAEVRKFARTILEQCDEIDGPAVEPSIAPELVKADLGQRVAAATNRVLKGSDIHSPDLATTNDPLLAVELLKRVDPKEAA